MAAASSGAPIREALYPLSKVEPRGAAAQRQLWELGKRHLEEPGPTRLFAVEALARAGPVAVPALARLVVSASAFELSERIEAARGLARLGGTGRQALEDALAGLVRTADPSFVASLEGPSFGLLRDILDTLGRGAELALGPRARLALFALAHLALPAAAGQPLALRIVHLRCAAASVLVNEAVDDPLLTSCDPSARSETFELALLRVLDRRPIRSRHLELWNTLVRSCSPARA